VWLTDRTLVGDLIGDYASLPDLYALGDYERETAGFDGAASCGQTPAPRIPLRPRSGWGDITKSAASSRGSSVSATPAADSFGDLIERLRKIPLGHERRAGRGDVADP
jgi:hypothetical protein